jgi:hypothetical protein
LCCAPWSSSFSDTTYHKAADIAQQKLTTTQISLKHYFAIAPMEQYFEFTSPSGSNVTINARTMHILDTPLGVIPATARVKTESFTAEQKQKIESLRREHERKAQEAWDKIGNNIGAR